MSDAPFFECPGCGKDIADMDTSHAHNCTFHHRANVLDGPPQGYCTCGRHASDQCEFCKRHIDGVGLAVTRHDDKGAAS